MLIKVKVLPESKKVEIIKKAEDRFEIKIKAKPEKGLANKEVMKVLSEYFKTPETKIRLIKGHTQRNKIFEILK